MAQIPVPVWEIVPTNYIQDNPEHYIQITIGSGINRLLSVRTESEIRETYITDKGAYDDTYTRGWHKCICTLFFFEGGTWELPTDRQI